MTTVVRAIYEERGFRLKKPLDLKLGQEVELIVREVRDIESDPAFDLASLAVETGVSDLATEHDHYLYGLPKRGTQIAE
ncbi:MAG: hypothetical protein COS88_01890 [Chloroflexi bacterium CG07_land_8_20_14_0_80_51_10]|nr:MAG: hypothetical protein COS88_01890 [Chloroflexi bacterium CG07_land_8_20_14_0_80_51_10]